MPEQRFDAQTCFDMHGRTAVITGGSGQLERAIAAALARAGARVAVLGRHAETAQSVATSIQADGGAVLGMACDVLDRAALERSREQVRRALGPVDILINAAGGDSPAATTSAERSFFDLDLGAARHGSRQRVDDDTTL
jgi:NAD(P)-dependent dehydrogenase (short-subunit alcohol dehydrogenase family)